MAMLETVLKRFEEPDEVRTFEKGKFELVHIGGMTIGRETPWPVTPGRMTRGRTASTGAAGSRISACAAATISRPGRTRS